MSALPAETVRERLLRAAAELFYDEGLTATGIDAITQRAGVAKQSLYNNFASKADLVAAYIEARHAEWLGLYGAREVQVAAQDNAGKILAVFDAYGDHAAFAYARGFRGCGLLNAAAELPAGHEGRAAVRRHKEEVDAILTSHLARLLPDQPEEVKVLTAHLSFLLEGAMVRAGLEGSGARVQEARAIAQALLQGRSHDI
ncbi:TetR/AcrR family transcriptional regulator [Pseudooceanicola spongiae]|uniref:TetR family transcriptional regulator n=1 Tax=Pseudooceanicola spongiae TaxID=2613965 RepID=A0A7L9WK95_9RHOB|nr:TetR/AcrR family transcriptional regulator [Pseudooceanicola spongiae]QOL80137.1 TetR family transcriptional regulator [Pseudooceanicola spongiae]